MRAADVTSTARKRRQRVPAGPPQEGDSSVNETLTPRGRRDIADYTGFVLRAIRGLSRAAERGDLQALIGLREADRVVALETLRAIQALMRDHGYSWTEIGLAAGISRQGAQQRWGG